MMNKKGWGSGVMLIALVLAAALLHGCASKNANQIKAEQFAVEKDFDAAVERYNMALQEDPDNLDLQLRLNDAKQKASLAHMRKAMELISNKFYKEAIEELQVSIAFYSSNHRAIELIDQTKRMKESAYYTEKGEKQIRTGDYEGAKTSFQKAVQLDSENQEAVAALEKFKKHPEALSRFRLDLRSNDPISLKFKKTPVLNVFEILSKISGINFIFDKDVKETPVTLFMTDVSFDRFLEVILKTNSLKAKMINRKTMLIYPDTPAKAKEYDDLYVKTFYLSYLKSKDAVAILTKILKSKDIIANEKLNAVTIRGSKESVDSAGRIIKANDRTPSELVLNVEIMEVSRKREKDLGLSISESITFGISETSSGIDNDTNFGLATLGSIKDISRITSNELYLSLPTATLKLLKKDGDTRILAKPQVRVSSSEKASILIGEKVPLRSNRKVQTDGTTTYDFLYQDVGVKLVTEPVINMFGQVTLTLSIEISALGNNVGTTDDPQFAIKTRSTSTVLTVNDGDSVIIGGLIEDEDRATYQRIPLFGDVPVMGRLFSSENSENIKTDILMTITPVIIRAQDVPEKEIAAFWSGTEESVSQEVPMEEKIRKQTDYNDIPDNDYIARLQTDIFLPTDQYFSIQVYSSKDEADALMKKAFYELQGYSAWVMPAQIENKGTFHRVFIGQYDAYQKAENARQAMLKLEIFPKDIHIVDRDYVYQK